MNAMSLRAVRLPNTGFALMLPFTGWLVSINKELASQA